jgi:hypothetical protein
MKDFWEFDNNPTIEEIIHQFDEVGAGSHGIKPFVEVEMEDSDEEFKIVGARINRTGCGCDIGVTLMIEKKVDEG